MGHNRIKFKKNEKEKPLKDIIRQGTYKDVPEFIFCWPSTAGQE